MIPTDPQDKLRAEIEQFFCGPNESFTNPEGMKDKLVDFIAKREREAVEQAVPVILGSILEDYALVPLPKDQEATALARKLYAKLFPPSA